MNKQKPSPTGLIDPVNGLPVRRHTASGGYYVPKPGWAHFWGRSLDALVVIVAAGVLMAVLNSLVQNLALGPLSFALLDSTGLFAAALAAVWFTVLFAYGMVWGSLGSVGDAAAGMRSVRISDGTTSGAWLGGWRAICWSFAPLYLVMAIAVAFSGGGGDSFSANFVSIDRRSGVAGGDAPVPDPKDLAAKQAAGQEHQQLPGLYDHPNQRG
ncbi:hypothetical protein [uncultured Arthrobacter sp.]|uniref:hypothetical protein n=1 Tax=uncultured Arthrobacter sp. TaxID=114050 RepID=UPI0032162735